MEIVAFVCCKLFIKDRFEGKRWDKTMLHKSKDWVR